MNIDFSAIRFGRILDGRFDDSDTEQLHMSFAQSEALIANVLDNASAYGREIKSALLKDGDFSEITDKQFIAKFFDKFQSAEANRTSKLLPTVDLHDQVVRLGDYFLLARPTFGFCPGLNGPHEVGEPKFFSKIWIRFINIGRVGQKFGMKLQLKDEETVFQMLSERKNSILDCVEATYKIVCESHLRRPIKFRTIGTLNLFSVNTDALRFDRLRTYWLEAEKVGPKVSSEARLANRNLSKLASKVFGAELVSDDPKGVIQELRKRHPQSITDVVFLEDPEGTMGLYFAEVKDESATFVGVAREHEESPAENEATPKTQSGKLKASTSPANISTAILANDLAVGF